MERAERTQRSTSKHDARCRLAEKLCSEAERDKKSNRILLVPFVVQIFTHMDLKFSPYHAMRKYNDWLKWAADLRKQDLTWKNMHHDNGPCCWPIEKVQSSKATKDSLKEFRSRFEVGKRKALRDEQVAKWLAVDLFYWREAQGKATGVKPPRSRKEDTQGEFVSPKNKGAGRDEEGKFTEKT